MIRNPPSTKCSKGYQTVMQNQESKTRVLFVLTTLDPGGAQRVMLTLLKHLPAHRFDLHLAIVDMRGRFLHEVPDDVEVHDLKAKRIRRSYWPLLRLIRRLKPDVVFSTMTRLNLTATLLKPLMPPGTKLVIREVTLANAVLGNGLWRPLQQRLLKNCLPVADTIVCLSDFMRQDLHEILSLPMDKMVTIYNPVDFAVVQSLALQGRPFPDNDDGPHVVAVGRLKQPVKGFDRLIGAFPALLKLQPNAQLWILGEGESAQELRGQANTLGITNRVNFPGFQANPYRWLCRADLFVLSSRFEGTSNVLLEAIACQCPVIVLDHPGGTREMMDLTGQQSRIVQDLSCWDPAWFERPDERIFQLAKQQFGIATIVEQYAEIFENQSQNNRQSKAA